MPSNTKEKVVTIKPAETSEPQVTIEDIRLLEGPYVREYEGKVYFTIRGRVIAQLFKDSAFSAFAYKDENDETPVHHSAEAIDIMNAGCGAYKPGMNSSFGDAFTKPELAGKKMRSTLVMDCIRQIEVEEDINSAQLAAIRSKAISEWAHQKSNAMGKGSDGKPLMSYNSVVGRIKAGANNLTEMDDTWDEAFLTKAVRFVAAVDGGRKPFTFGELDTSNLNLLTRICAGRAPEQSSGAVKIDDIAI